MRKIEWTPDGTSSLHEILEYYMFNAGEGVAGGIYGKIIRKVDMLRSETVRSKRSQELKDIGILDIYELVINPWKVYYKISNNNTKIYILFVIDARRNIEEILISKVINNKI